MDNTVQTFSSLVRKVWTTTSLQCMNHCALLWLKSFISKPTRVNPLKVHLHLQIHDWKMIENLGEATISIWDVPGEMIRQNSCARGNDQAEQLCQGKWSDRTAVPGEMTRQNSCARGNDQAEQLCHLPPGRTSVSGEMIRQNSCARGIDQAEQLCQGKWPGRTAVSGKMTRQNSCARGNDQAEHLC